MMTATRSEAKSAQNASRGLFLPQQAERICGGCRRRVHICERVRVRVRERVRERVG